VNAKEAVEELWNRLKLDVMIHAASKPGLETSRQREAI